MNFAKCLTTVLALFATATPAIAQHTHADPAAAAAPARSPVAAAPATAPAAPGAARAAAPTPPAPCPGADEARRIAEAYAGPAKPMPFAAAAKLKLPEVMVAGGLPPALGRGVDGTAFPAVWQSLTGWPTAMLLVLKGGNVFEFRSRILPGKPSTRSRYFNVDHGEPFSGHLRPDLVTAIHAVQMPGEEGAVRGVFFYDGSGESVFGVMLPEGSEAPEPAQLAAFERTWALLGTLPGRCTNASR